MDPAASPLHLLCIGTPPPALAGSPFGPYLPRVCGTLEEAEAALREQVFEALLVQADSEDELQRLILWPGMAAVVMDAALVVVADAPSPSWCLRLLQMGVQDVLSARALSDDALARALRLAVERKRLEAAARRALSTDLTTGLPTHAQLLEHMTQLLALREREPAAMALIVLRLEGLRAAETALGAEAANVLRRKAAVRLRAGLRASDVVTALGNDMYGVLLAWIDAESDAEGVASKLLDALRPPFAIAGQHLRLAGTVGMAQYPAHGKDANALIRRAVGQAASGNLGPLGSTAAGAANDEVVAVRE